MLNRFGQKAVGLYARRLFQLDIEGRQHLPSGPKILVANHPTTSDPFLITTLTREPVHILVHHTFFHVPLLGAYLRAAGHIPVNPDNGPAVINQSSRLLSNGKTLAVFIEGGISPPQGFHPPKTGPVRLALGANVPIIPVGIHLPKDKIRHITTTFRGQKEVGRFYLSGPYHITIGKPLCFSGDPQDRQMVKSLTSQLMDRIVDLSSQSQTRFLSR